MKTNQNSKVSRMMKIALFSALSFVVMLFEFPFPFLPAFLKFDLSDVIILLSGFTLGGLDMLLVILFKNLLHLLMKGAASGIPINEFASILSSVSFCFPFYFMMKKYGQEKIAISQKVQAVVLATASLTLVMFVSNYFFITPFYFKLWGMPLPDDYMQFMLAYVPFNAIKGIIIGSIFFIPAVTQLVKKLK